MYPNKGYQNIMQYPNGAGYFDYEDVPRDLDEKRKFISHFIAYSRPISDELEDEVNKEAYEDRN